MNATCQVTYGSIDMGAFRANRSEASWEAAAHALLKGIVLSPNLIDLAQNIARNPVLPTLIYGETGTGKEEYAKYIHRLRCLSQPNIPFVAVNCANLTGELALSALFGHKKGSFTGATQDALGYVAAAQGGILFLDEVHTLDRACQQKLLRVLNDGTYQALGSSQDSHSQFQLICASTRDLDEASEQGEFLLDLWMRLMGFEARLPSLRDRLEDVPAIIRAFLLKEKISIPETELKKLIQNCQTFHWQGNIRQMLRSLKVLLALSGNDGSRVKAENLPIYRSMHAPHAKDERKETVPPSAPLQSKNAIECSRISELLQSDTTLDQALECFEKLVIQVTMQRHRSVMEAGRVLGISRSSFALKRQKYGLISKNQAGLMV